MNPTELAADALNTNIGMMTMALGDLSDADLMTRIRPGANHAAWQLGHLIVSENSMVSAIKPGALPALPAGFDKKFKKENAGNDDPAFFPKKKELVDLLAKTRTETVAWIKTLTPADLDKPAPEPIRSFCPTVGHMMYILGSHVAMHLGQIQVLRRKLGKPILF